MATTLNLLNEVLTGLRQPRLSSGTTEVTKEYHLLLLQFLNTAKDEVEEAWDWHALRNTVTITGTASTSVYTVDTGGQADVDATIQSRLLYSGFTHEGELYETTEKSSLVKPQVYDTTTATEAFQLIELTPEQMEFKHLTDDNTEQAKPSHFTIYRDADDLFFRVWPVPSGARTWKVRLLIPQAELDDADVSTTLSVPARPVWQRALHYANAERGEELGAPWVHARPAGGALSACGHRP